MRLNSLYPALLATALLSTNTLALRSDKIKLSNVQSLTLRKDLKTSHRRVPAVPQLKCIGGSAKRLYEIDVMRCKNSGADYSSEDIQWTCTASLPDEFKLGSTDVICEGYESADDPYVLKGSCGVEYRLVLTSKGEEKYGKGKKGGWFGGGEDGGGEEGYPETTGSRIVAAVFWMVFIAVAVWIVYNAFLGWSNRDQAVGAAGGRPGWGGGGGGGGWGGGNDDPPPPYDYQPPRNNPKQSYGGTQNEGWRPGFWSGALGGAAAGYGAGRMGNRTNNGWQANNGWGNQGSGWGGSGWGNGEGSSRSSSGSSSYSSTRHESTGFGSTSRR
ncbi:DUF1183-domain-containing protein [Lophiostoma macrostomum CBS 122681]|uniref:Store-operated calcium entry-associated regulatory factor n=1 Tax=Lophiostoma macrostomum CBS 122681 TaxID=1314788 RepID=A0A6A6SXM9_9PLEO|nr:DUF1183-domain-containing protein [Lophiostoma macrostomum CBS 122681]